ncbi:MAG: thioredoxin family protein [Candidatus Paceibacterota bacterium]
MNPRIVLYKSENCPNCKIFEKELLESAKRTGAVEGKDYELKMIVTSEDYTEALMKNVATIPTLLVDGFVEYITLAPSPEEFYKLFLKVLQ